LQVEERHLARHTGTDDDDVGEEPDHLLEFWSATIRDRHADGDVLLAAEAM